MSPESISLSNSIWQMTEFTKESNIWYVYLFIIWYVYLFIIWYVYLFIMSWCSLYIMTVLVLSNSIWQMTEFTKESNIWYVYLFIIWYVYLFIIWYVYLFIMSWCSLYIMTVLVLSNSIWQMTEFTKESNIWYVYLFIISYQF